MTSTDNQLELLMRGVEIAAPEGELAKRLATGKRLRVKLGLDPTAPAVTLGWAVVLRKLRHFQECGHTAVLIVGDFTAQVGDPSGRSATRPALSQDQIREYADSVLNQFQRVLLPDPLEIRYNSEWLADASTAELIDYASRLTVAQVMERSDFTSRLREGRAISLREFLYPVLQAIDSVKIKADVELGGSDQLWNLVLGRTLMDRLGMDPQLVITMPLLIGTDGVQKMSQSLRNYIGVDDPAAEMFGKVMSIPDHLMGQWFRLAADLPENEVLAIEAGLADDALHPGDTKRRLAREVVSLYWGPEAAGDAEAAFDRQFRHHQAPEDVPIFELGPEDQVFLPALLRDAGLVSSSSEARRLLAQGGIKLEGERLDSEQLTRSQLAGKVLQVGKRRFARFVGGA